MLRKIYASTDYGVHSLIKVVATLRRKEFDVVGVNMDCFEDNRANICITLREKEKLNVEYAKYQLEKIIDITNIKIDKGDH